MEEVAEELSWADMFKIGGLVLWEGSVRGVSPSASAVKAIQQRPDRSSFKDACSISPTGKAKTFCRC